MKACDKKRFFDKCPNQLFRIRHLNCKLSNSMGRSIRQSAYCTGQGEKVTAGAGAIANAQSYISFERIGDDQPQLIFLYTKQLSYVFAHRTIAFILKKGVNTIARENPFYHLRTIFVLQSIHEKNNPRRIPVISTGSI